MLNLNHFERPSTGMQDPSFFPLQYTCTALKVIFVAVVFFFNFLMSQGSDASLGRFSPMACYVKTVWCVHEM